MKKINKLIYGITIFLVLLVSISFIPQSVKHDMKEQEREDFISLKLEIQQDLMKQGKYKCCLEKPCTYCIEKTPGHGEGASCTCLEDVVNGVHPCGECIGEIMEGHGNPLLTEYFATAISEEVGEQHLPTIKKIVEEKYGMPIENQI